MNYLNDPHYDMDEAQLDHFDQGAAKRQRYQLWKERLNQVELQIEKDQAAAAAVIPSADLSQKEKDEAADKSRGAATVGGSRPDRG